LAREESALYDLVVEIPSRLRSTTLGDVLGTLHRGRATGRLDLEDTRGDSHQVFLLDGGVVAAHLGRSTASLYSVLREIGGVDGHVLQRSLLVALAGRRLHGDVLVREFRVSREIVDRAVRRQIIDRLTWIESLGDAQLAFHVAVRPPRGALLDAPLAKDEFLRGRVRARGTRASSSGAPAAPPVVDTARARALATLGLGPDAGAAEVRAKYRAIVRACHPDLHPGEDSRSLSARLQRATEAYRALAG